MPEAAVLANPLRGPLTVRDPPEGPRRFHHALPDYRPTPLVEAPLLAQSLGVAHVYVKVESQRLGLPSFKGLGAAWAVAVALCERFGAEPNPAGGIEALRALVAGCEGLTLLAATDGNHGRAVARLARRIGIGARILVPSNLARARVEVIAREGAELVMVDGSYDDAVRQSAAEAGGDTILVSDTSWAGYERVPAAVVDGYATILDEVDRQLAEAGARIPDEVVVQIGVGAFAAAVVRHFRRDGASVPRLIGVEPVGAACVHASLRAGELVEVPGPHDSIMAGLNCGRPSLVAWPTVSRGLDVAVTVEDELAREGMRQFARTGLEAGECAGAAWAGAATLRAGALPAGVAPLSPDSSVLLFLTEGATDPAGYLLAVGETPAEASLLAPGGSVAS